jgi:hypothetical protein
MTLSQQSASASALDRPELDRLADEEVARFWLSVSQARALLNNQLAALLRTILDGRTATGQLPWNFCPLCALALSRYEQPDCWVEGLRCQNGHEWTQRGGQLWGGTDHCLMFAAEFPATTVPQLIRGWLSNSVYAPQLHESVARVFRGWLRNV